MSAAAGCRRLIGAVALCAAIVPLQLGAQTIVAGALPGQFGVGPSGAATYTMPIQVPPGIAGMEPKLAISYSGQGGNGLFGNGWSLEGGSAITRCPRTMAQDGVRGAVNFDLDDRYCLDGERLVLASGTYGAPDSEYRTELDKFSRIIARGTFGAGPMWFDVHTKSGLLMRYGYLDDSRIARPPAPRLSAYSTVGVWALTTVSDARGNKIEWTYYKQMVDGVWYPREIRYGKANASATGHRIYFNAVTRPDRSHVYQAGFHQQQAVRINYIEVIPDGATASLYEMGYMTGGGGVVPPYSQLQTIRRCALNPYQCTQPAVFGYTAGTLSTSTSSTVLGDGMGSTLQGILPADINGDGRGDLLYWWYDTVPGTGLKLRSKIGDGAGGFTQVEHSDGDGMSLTPGAKQGIEVTDINGDGKSDVLYWWYDTTPGQGLRLRSKIGAGNGTFTHVEHISGDGMDAANYGVTTADINGDGFADVVYWYDAGNPTGLVIRTKFGNGAGGFTAAEYVSGDGMDSARKGVRVGDINGDGRADLIYWYVDSVRGLLIRSKISLGNGQFTAVEHQSGEGMGYSHEDLLFADVNGDGLTDIVYWFNHPTNGLVIRTKIGDGTGWFGSAEHVTGDGMGSAYKGVELGDVNGDGKLDIVYWFYDLPPRGLVGRYKVGDGLGGFIASEKVFGDGMGSTYQDVLLMDVNGDGKSDLVYWFYTTPGSVGAGLNVRAKMSDGVPDGKLWTAYTPGSPARTITYASLTASSVYTKDEGATAAISPQVDVQMPMFVVREVHSQDGLGGHTATRYRYGGLKAERGTGRGLLGFRWTSATNQQTGIESYSEFRQDWPYVGMPSKSETRIASGGNAGVLKRVTSSYGQGPGSSAAAKFVYATQSVEQSWDLNGAVLPTITSTFQFGQQPQYGDPTSITVSNGDGSSKTTVNEYWPASTSGGSWILGRLKRASVTSVRP